MAGGGLITGASATDLVSATFSEDQGTPTLFRRPSELSVLSDALVRSVFTAGLLVSCLFTAYAAVLSAGQVGDRRAQGVASCLVILGLEVGALSKHRAAFAFLSRHNAAILIPAVVIGLGGWLTGENNDQYFFVLPILLGVIGVAVGFRWICLASLVAVAGLLAPAPTDAGQVVTAAFSIVVPPIFWLIVDSLARFMLHLQRILTLSLESPSSPVKSRGNSSRFAVRKDRAGDPEGPTEIPERAHSLHDWDVQEPRALERVALGDVKLTARQLQAVFYCCDGLSDSEIADAMDVSVRQVRRFLSDARERAGCDTREQLAAWAITLRLIPLEA